MGVVFNWDYFFSNACSVAKKAVTVKDIKSAFTPWHQKDGEIGHAFEEIEKDKGYCSIRLNEANNYAAKVSESDNVKLPTELDWFLIATDLDIKESLILDGNHTLMRLYKEYPNTEIEIIEIFGSSMENLVPDFKIIKRYCLRDV